MNMNTQDKITALRCIMDEAGIDGYVVPKSDEYQGEFVAGYAERLVWLTGFTGSAGMACVLADKAIVFTDARYTIQIAQQVDGGVFETADKADITPGDWLSENARKGAVIGYDPWLHTPDQIQRLERDGLEFKALEVNLIDRIWSDQPERPNSPVFAFPDDVAGKTVLEKLKIVQQNLQNQGVGAFVLTLPDSIAWLLNIRASDIEYIPLAFSYALVHANVSRIEWFIDENRLGCTLPDEVSIVPPARLQETLRAVEGVVGVGSASAPIWFRQALGERAIAAKDPCAEPKSIKTKSEQNTIRAAHILDGIALVKFLKWFEEESPKNTLSELDAAQQLKLFRQENAAFKSSSFPTICGFGGNGAIVHYRATKESNAPINGDGLLLIDSGAQYAGEAGGDDVFGTTDITRTIAVGRISAEMKRAFTLVLKGHIAVAAAKFPDGTTGAQIDTLARHSLWREGMDFAHGTGHGVGCYLAVHEEAASLSPRGYKAIKPGMLLSNEPGYYKEGEFGIRIENLVLVQDTGDKPEGSKALYEFETVSFAPIDMRCVDETMLNKREKKWLDSYHKQVFDKLSPHLDKAHKDWLEGKTLLSE